MSRTKPNKSFKVLTPLYYGVVCITACLLAACAPQHKDAIMFGTNTQVGVKVGVDEKQVPTVIIGYNRQEAALVPLLVYGDGQIFDSTYRDLDTSAYLNGVVRYSTEAIDDFSDAAKKSIKIELIKESATQAARSIKVIKEAGAISEVDSDYVKLETQANALTSASTRSDFTKLIVLAEALLNKPSLAQEYYKEMKYTAEVSRDVNGKSTYTDSYSVLGIFNGSAKGKSTSKGGNGGLENNTEASGQLAQYFATGMAAQNLSMTPASVSANAGAVEAATKKYVKVSQEELDAMYETKSGQVDAILKALLDSHGAVDTAKVDQLYKKPGGLVPKLNATNMAAATASKDALSAFLDSLTKAEREKSLKALEFLN